MNNIIHKLMEAVVTGRKVKSPIQRHNALSPIKGYTNPKVSSSKNNNN